MKSGIKSTIPYSVKRLLRLIKYNDERKQFFRERVIKKTQDNLIQTFNKETENLIVFLMPGADRKTGRDIISGGNTSIVSICEETIKLSHIHNAEVIMCVFPREFLLLKHNNFTNDVNVFRFEQLPEYFKNVKNIIIYLPEFLVKYFKNNLFKSELNWLTNIPFVHLNIINANILIMPEIYVIKDLETISDKITITAAHTKYCTPYYRKLYGVPLHKFSAWISPEHYNFVKYDGKKELIVISPDEHPFKEKILQLLYKTNLEVKILQNLPYNEFKEIVSRAKWAITFGEGLDGYILEPIFSGTIGFAVYNEDFFTEDFKNSNGIYSSYTEMADSIIPDIKMLDQESNYEVFQKKQFDLCAKHYNYNEYKQNIRLFYKQQYTYP